MSITLGVLGVVSIIITLVYAFKIKIRINASINHLTQILERMKEYTIPKDMFDINYEPFFLSKETK